MSNIKVCIAKSRFLTIEALNEMLRIVRESNTDATAPRAFGTPLRFYGESEKPYGREFTEWGLICENGTVCSKAREPQEETI